jgi:hypothetical protein
VQRDAGAYPPSADKRWLPGSRTLTLREEAEQLLAYSALQRAEYLHEVWCNPNRGPSVAHELQREVALALAR